MWSTATASPNFLTTSTSLTSTVGTFARLQRGGTRPRSRAPGSAEDMVATARVSTARYAPRRLRCRARFVAVEAGDDGIRDHRGERTGAGDALREVGVRYRRFLRQNTARSFRAVEGTPPPMPSLTHDAVIDAMRTVQEPELGRDLITLDMVKDVVIDGSSVSLKIELTTPACPLKDEIERTTHAALGAIGATGIDITWGAMVRRSQPRAAEQLVPGVKNDHRRRIRQGRGRQEHGQRQSRGRAGPGRRLGRPARCRHHRPQHPDDARPRGPAQGQREQQDHAARALRRQGDLDPVLRARRASRSSGAGRSSVERSSSSCAMSTGASSTISSSTCRPGPPMRS